MTNEEIRIAIAEVCGWSKEEYRGQTHCQMNGCVEKHFEWRYKGEPTGHSYHERDTPFPNYPEDLNAMQSAVLAQSNEFQQRFNERMINRTGHFFFHKWTASDWAEEFIATKQELSGGDASGKDERRVKASS